MVITISRQYLAGSADVAARVGETLGWRVIDDNLIGALAERSGLSAEDVQNLEEQAPSFLERLGRSLALSSPENLLSTPSAIEGPEELRLAHATREVIRELSSEDRLIFVGRSAASVLASDRDAIHVRLVASFEHRVRLARAVLGLSEDEARSQVRDRDVRRARYHEELFERDWNDPVNYHMVLNTEALGTAGAAESIVARARSLGWSSL